MEWGGDMRAVLQETASAFVQNNTAAVRSQDPSLFSAVLAPDCRRALRPLALVPRYPPFFFARVEPGDGELSNAEYEALMAVELRATTRDVAQAVLHTVVHEAQQRRVTLLVESAVTTRDGEQSTVEIVWDLDFTRDGRRVKRVVEFAD
ncbi:hypothetical protein GGR56DRAFT_384205 [Xylariaceae sp. FL0804]|nr:hypothetical protein GGR56DRAFT_384205 [Xylariaceae sp. FL0804]